MSDYTKFETQQLTCLKIDESPSIISAELWFYIQKERPDLNLKDFLFKSKDQIFTDFFGNVELCLDYQTRKKKTVVKGNVYKTSDKNNFLINNTIYYLPSDREGIIEFKDRHGASRNFSVIKDDKPIFDNEDALVKYLLENEKVVSVDTAPETVVNVDNQSLAKISKTVFELFAISPSILSKHIQEAYVDCKVFEKIKKDFSNSEEEALKTLYAVNRVFWLSKNKKFTYEKAKSKVSTDLNVPLTTLNSLCGTKNVLNRHKKGKV
jgi:hypothetical protein